MTTKIEIKKASQSPVKQIIEPGNLVSAGSTVVMVLQNNPDYWPEEDDYFTGMVLKSDCHDIFTVHNDFNVDCFEQFVGTVNLVGVP